MKFIQGAIYSMDGRLVKKATVPEGSGSIAVDFRGSAVVAVHGRPGRNGVASCFLGGHFASGSRFRLGRD